MLRGIFAIYRGGPVQASGPGGRMALGDHVRELRARILRAVTVLVLGTVVALLFYSQIADFLTRPYYDARNQLDPSIDSQIVINGLATSLLIQVKVCVLASVVATSPYWLYQIWGFILPALHSHERRWSRIFLAIAGPLFVTGAAIGFLILPKGIEVLISFTPADVTNFVQLDDYVSFMTRMVLIFGVAFELPLFIVMLNFAGVLSGKALGSARPWIIVGIFVFAAVATPSTDPISMCFLAVPMLLLSLIAEVLARLNDRRRGARTASHDVGDDELSPL